MKYRVFNATDGIFASPQEFTLEAGRKFIRDFPKRFKAQGFYTTSRGEHIKPEDVQLELQPS